MNDLSKKMCKPCEKGALPMTQEEVLSHLVDIPKWQVGSDDSSFIFREFEFKNYYQTMAFVNAVAWISHTENHHPNLEVSYSKCIVKYFTHAINGLSLNDFICATKVNQLCLPV